MMYVDRRQLARKAEVATALEQMCQSLEPTRTQFELAKGRYEGVGRWLADAVDPDLKSVAVYLQGSTALGTAIRPIGDGEFDIDLVAFMRSANPLTPPALIKRKIGDRLRANGLYAPLPKEKQRCWRLEYAGEFHLDITPSIPDPDCAMGGELVPDKSLKLWKPTNPKSYKSGFLRRAELVPRLRIEKALAEDRRFRADAVEPYPRQKVFKGVLPRCVQIMKRHRDLYFDGLGVDSSLAPISVIITTLAAWSYEHCVSFNEYDDELDLLCDVIRRMPTFIGTRFEFGRTLWFIWNETTNGENFAEKWNAEPARVEAFFAWHERALSDVEGLTNVEGLDRLMKSFGSAFGAEPARRTIDAMTDNISAARKVGALFAAPAIGLSAAPAAAATVVRSNTFFGR
jgi:Second Messenger Oligonucleotide or Dinucleotide Synthetase domain